MKCGQLGASSSDVALELSPSPWALSRALEIAGRQASLTTIQRLAGGTHADTYLIRTTHPELALILREFPANDETAANEQSVLATLDGLGGLAPRLLAASTDTVLNERPWLLISQLPGLADLSPHDTEQYASELGQTLARIHATPMDRLSGLQSIFDRPGDLWPVLLDLRWARLLLRGTTLLTPVAYLRITTSGPET